MPKRGPKPRRKPADFDPAGLEWPTTEDEALYILSLWVAPHRQKWREWVELMASIMGVGITADIHEALYEAGLVKDHQTNTSHLLGVGKKVTGDFTLPRLRVVLDTLGLSARWAVWDIEILPIPADAKGPQGPAVPEVMKLLKLLATERKTHRRFNMYRRAELLKTHGMMRACASYLLEHGFLKVKNLKTAEVTLIQELSGSADQGHRALRLMTYMGLCACIELKPDRLARHFMAWLKERAERYALFKEKRRKKDEEDDPSED